MNSKINQRGVQQEKEEERESKREILFKFAVNFITIANRIYLLPNILYGRLFILSS